jgi:hypothetical protein
VFPEENRRGKGTGGRREAGPPGSGRRGRGRGGATADDGGGGGIRTRDLWVMSPTSCRCSTPRQSTLPNPHKLVRSRPGGRGRPRRPRLPQGCPCSTLRRCGGSRPGSGWDRVGPPRSRPRAPPTPRPETATLAWIRVLLFALVLPTAARLPRAGRTRLTHLFRFGSAPNGERSPAPRTTESALVHAHRSAPVCCQPSTSCRSTRSSPGELTSCEWGSSSRDAIPA